jgi:hemerythrin
MQLLIWEDRFSVGIKEFDQHHKILFEMINSLIIAKEEGRDQRVILNALEQLKSYTLFHFAAEETMMEHFGFDGLDAHVEEHQHLLDQVKKYQARFQTKGDLSIDELLEFLAGWLLDHTLGLDQDYGPFLRHRVE